MLTVHDDLGHLHVFTLHHDAHSVLGLHLLGAHTNHRHYQNGVRLDVLQCELTVEVRNGSVLCSFHQDVHTHQGLVVVCGKHSSRYCCLRYCHSDRQEQ